VILYKKEINKENATMNEERNYFASNLRFLRQKHGLEQIDLATRLGRKSSSSISEWEKGKYIPNKKNLEKRDEKLERRKIIRKKLEIIILVSFSYVQ